MNQGNIVSMDMPTEHGVFVCSVWPGQRGCELMALSTPRLDTSKEVMVRIHSECLTGDVFSSKTCDCGAQKDRSLKLIDDHGNGIFIYHRQEGRNMGLYKKVQAYNLMQKGIDTHEANIRLAGHPDGREYGDVLMVLSELLGSTKSKIRLLTNNPYKKLFLMRHGYSVVIEPLVVATTRHNGAYVETKYAKFLHGAHGSEPYVGITIYRNDLGATANLKKMLTAINLKDCGRKVYVGIAVFPEKGDTRDLVFASEINTFAAGLSSLSEVHVVLRINYPESRSAYNELKKFLALLSFGYSLQFRYAATAARVDTELIDSLHADRIIFQIKSEHFYLLDQKDFREYFSRPHRSLLLDESWGTDSSASFESTREKILYLVSRGMSRIGVAGGYCAENADRVFEFEDFFKIPISTDAETRLRHDSRLSIADAEKYLWRILRPSTAFCGLTLDQAIEIQKKFHQHAGEGRVTLDIEISNDLTLKDFQVHKHVLNPNIVSDARLFARALHEQRRSYAGKSVIDMGTGSGILGIVMALDGAGNVVCADVSPEATANARANVETYSLKNQVSIVQSDLFSALKGIRADVIVFNHPYFPGAPIADQKISIAMMDSGDLLQRFLKEAKDHLNPDGIIIMPYHEFAGDVNDPEKHATKYGYDVRVERQEANLAFRKEVFKICTLSIK